MRGFKVTYAITTPESVKNSDFAETGWIDEEGISCEPDKYDIDDGVTAVHIAIKLLKENAATHPSTSGNMNTHCWWTNYDYDTNFRTAAVEQRSYHPYGWSVEELDLINQGVKS